MSVTVFVKFILCDMW